MSERGRSVWRGLSLDAGIGRGLSDQVFAGFEDDFDWAGNIGGNDEGLLENDLTAADFDDLQDGEGLGFAASALFPIRKLLDGDGLGLCGYFDLNRSSDFGF